MKYGDSDTLSSLGCDPSDLWAMVVHGWRNGPSTSSWIPDLTKNLNKYRGGCVIVIDFFYYSSSISYFVLVRNFPGISAVLLKKLNQMFKEGFKASNGYIFGFSLGAQLVIDVGMKLNGTVDRIDGIP